MQQRPHRVPVLIAAGVAAVVLVLAWQWNSRPGGSALAPVGSLPAIPADTSELLSPPVVDTTEARAEVAIASPGVAPAPFAVEEPGTLLRGRCVAAEDGAPLAEVEIAFSGEPRISTIAADEALARISPVRTGADGRFELRFGPVHDHRYTLSVNPSGRTPRLLLWGPPETRPEIDLGDIECTRGHVVEGQVIGEDGRPVRGVGFGVAGLPLQLEGSTTEHDTLWGRSDEDGVFRVDGAVPPGTWPVLHSGRGWMLLEPATVTVDEFHGAAPVIAIVRRLPSISGVVVDTRGVPVQGVRLRIQAPSRDGRILSSVTDVQGRFTLHARDEERETERVIVDDPGPCEPPQDPGPRYAWGTSDVRIVLSRSRSVELEVVERGSGAAVTEYAVVCYPKGSGLGRERDARLSGSHAEGRVSVDRVRPGTNRLQVRPADRLLEPSDWIDFEGVDQPAALRVELERMGTGRVRVVGAGREPMAGSEIELVRLGSVRADDMLRRANFAPDTMTFSGDPLFRESTRLYRAESDGNGEAEIVVPADLTDVLLRIRGELHTDHLRIAPPLRAEAVHEVVVDRGARVEGSFRVHGYGKTPQALSFARVGEDLEQPLIALLDPDGGFRSPQLEPGEYDMSLAVQLMTWVELTPCVQRLVLGDGQVLAIDRSAPEWDAATLTGRVRLDGGAPTGAWLQLQLDRPRSWIRMSRIELAEDGSFEIGGLPPGSWRPLLGIDEPDPLHSPMRFDLAGGEQRHIDFEFTRMRSVLRLLKADGVTPLKGITIVVDSTEPAFLATADAGGRVRFDRSLAVEIEFFLEGNGAARFRALLPEPGEENALDVVLPVDP